MNTNWCFICFADVACEAEGLDDVAEDISCMAFGVPMVDIDESDGAVRVLELMVLAVGGDISIRALRDGFADELRAAAAAKGHGLYLRVLRARVAHVRAIQTIAYMRDETVIIHRLRQTSDDAESLL